jgi:hypothetical protein
MPAPSVQGLTLERLANCTLQEHAGVAATAPSDGDVLQYNVSSGNWEPVSKGTFTGHLGIGTVPSSTRVISIHSDRTVADALYISDANASPYTPWTIGIGAGGAGDALAFYSNSTISAKLTPAGVLTLASYLVLGVTVAGTGSIRFPNAAIIAWRNQANDADVTLKVNTVDALECSGCLSLSGDNVTATAGVTYTGTVNSSVSSGTGTVKLTGSTSRNSTGWLKIWVGAAARYLPYWSDIS